MKQKMFIFFIIFALLLHQASADAVTAGISPDNRLLWRAEIFFEDFNAAITSNAELKAEKMLEHAAERVAEIEKMLRWNKTVEAEKSAEKHASTMEKLKEEIVTLEKKNTEKEFKEEIIIGIALEEYSSSADAIIKAIDGTQYTQEQNSVYAKFGTQNTGYLLALGSTIQEKKEATKLKLKANGISDADIIVIEENIKAGKKAIKTIDATSAATAISDDITAQVSDAASDIADKINKEYVAEKVTEKAEQLVEEISTIVTDTTAESKVKIDGDVTADQL